MERDDEREKEKKENLSGTERGWFKSAKKKKKQKKKVPRITGVPVFLISLFFLCPNFFPAKILIAPKTGLKKKTPDTMDIIGGYNRTPNLRI